MRTVLISEDKFLCDTTESELAQRTNTVKLSNAAVGKSWIVGNAEEVAIEIQHYREHLGMNYPDHGAA